MDNLSAYKVDGMRVRIEAAGAKLLDMASDVHEHHPGKPDWASVRVPDGKALDDPEVGAASVRVAMVTVKNS